MGMAVLFSSCTKEEEKGSEEPSSQGGGGAAPSMEVFVSTVPENNKVLIEELTGWGCQYCPDGHKRCDSLSAILYPGKVFSINVHTGTYAEGKTPDYTTDEGYTLLRTLGAKGFPCGYINRISWKTSSSSQATFYLGRGYFKPCAEQIMNKEQKAVANIASRATLNKSSRELKVKVQVCFTSEPQDTNFIINVALLQNNIKGPQVGAATWYPERWDGTNYTHNHMLRAYITGLKGDLLKYKGTGKDNVIEKTYTYAVPETLGKGNIPAVLEDLEVICYVTYKATSTSNPDEYFPLPVLSVCKSEMSYK